MRKMRSVAGYAGAALGVTVIVTGIVWPWAGADTRRGLLDAALVALGFQIPAFGLQVWIQERAHGLLLGLAGGMLARMGLVVVVAVIATTGDASRPWTVAVVLGLVGYLFALVLLEAWFIRVQAETTQGTEPTT